MKGLLLALGLLASLAIPASAQFNASLFKGGSGSSGIVARPVGSVGNAALGAHAVISLGSPIPAGSLVIVVEDDIGTTGAPITATYSDTSGNIGTTILHTQTTSGTTRPGSSLIFANVTTALQAGDSITITSSTGSNMIGATAIYITGQNASPHDATVDQNLQVTGITGTITGSTPAVASSLVVAWGASNEGSGDSASGPGSPWTAFPTVAAGQFAGIVASYQITSSAVSFTATDLGGVSVHWGMGITAFKP